MRRLQERYKVQGGSLVEIQRALRDEARRLTDVGFRYEERPLRQVHVLNGLLMWFLSLPEEDRQRIYAQGMACVLQALQSETEVSFPGLPAKKNSRPAQPSGSSTPDSRALPIKDVTGPARDGLDSDQEKPEPKRRPRRRI